MRILVLGGTGAMGEPLVRMLAERRHEIYVTSRRERESKANIHYIQGDAHNLSFIKRELNKNYDIIVDFMIYGTEEFRDRLKLYLNSTGQYMFLSSARVYADSKVPITENSPRLLDVCKDDDYLKTDEYALAKARAENELFNSGMTNWTIIRPYITYNTKRLQLGGMELSTWLTETLSGRPLVLPKDVGMRETTLTHGSDVARTIASLIGNDKALSEVFHITGTDHMKWRDVAKIYKEVLEEQTCHSVKIYEPETSEGLSNILGNSTQIRYDRMYNRVFDNTKVLSACREKFEFIHMRDGLSTCLKEYLNLSEEEKSVNHNIMYEVWLDKSIGKAASLNCLNCVKDKLKYIGYYYVPNIMNILKKLK